MTNNNYIKIYLEQLNKKTIQNKKCISAKQLKQNLIVQNKRKQIKNKLIKNLILEQSTASKQEEVNCHIDLLTHVAGYQNEQVDKPALLYIPTALFGNNEFDVQEIPSDKAEQLKGKIRGLINNAYSEALSNKQVGPILKDEKVKHCLVCFLIIKQQKGVIQYVLTTNYLKKLAFILPKDRDWFQKVKVDLHTFSEKHPKDILLQGTDFIISLPLDILSVVWLATKGIGQWLVRGTKTIFKDSAIASWTSDKFSDKNNNTQTKKIIGGLMKFTKANKEDFSKIPQDLQNKVLFAIGDEKAKPVEGLVNYNAILKNGDNVKDDQFTALKKLEEEFINAIGPRQAYEQAKEDPASIDQFPEKQKNAAYARQVKNPQFNRMCRTLGFKDKKKQKGFAALIEKMLENLFNFFGAGDDDPSEAYSDSQIKKAMQFVSKISKKLPPGRYPVYFGDKVTPAEMEERFKNLVK